MSTKGFKLVHLNTRSIFKKLNLIGNQYEHVDILCCSETWLDNRISNNLVKITGMQIYRTDRTQNLMDYNVHIVGGGVCIFLSKKWSDYSDVVQDYSFVKYDIEIISVRITRPGFKKILIACIYKPQRGKTENCIKTLTDLVNTYQKKNFEIWLLGDLNIDLLRRDDNNAVLLNRFFFFNLACHN